MQRIGPLDINTSQVISNFASNNYQDPFINRLVNVVGKCPADVTQQDISNLTPMQNRQLYQEIATSASQRGVALAQNDPFNRDLDRYINDMDVQSFMLAPGIIKAIAMRNVFGVHQILRSMNRL